MSDCPKCKSPLWVHKCMKCLHSETPKVKKDALPCEWPCMATIHVQESLTGKPILGVYTQLDGAPATTNANGFRVAEGLTPGDHVARISLTGLVDLYARPIGQVDTPITKAIAASENGFYTFTLDPLTPLKVVVRRRHDSQGVPNAKVTVTAGKAGNTVQTPEQTTSGPGEATFARLRQDTYKLAVELDDPGKAKYELEKVEDHHVLDMSKNPDEHVLWARLVIHLRLKYKDPDDTVRHFPKDFPFKVVFDDGKVKDVKVLDDAGYFKFEIEDAAKTKFTLKFDSPDLRYLVHEENKAAAELKVKPSEDDLFALGDVGKQYFALPKTWQLAQSAWDATNVVVPSDGQIVIPGDGIGTPSAPGELTLKPKLQYVRLEFFDRKYGHKDHNKKPVSIPAVALKAVRDAPANGDVAAGSHDAISNWIIDKADVDNACQCLPWIITKTVAGADLPQLNNKLMFEFGKENAFVYSTAPATRKIVVLPATDTKRKPTRDRNQYYDLPKLWKSKCYYTRFSDKTKNKFFDELAAADDPALEASYVKATRLTFSLDDIVLVVGAALTPVAKDKTDSDSVEVDFSEYSRLAVLALEPDADPKKKYKFGVYDPRDDAVYWSKCSFQKESTGAPPVQRNVIIDYPVNPRAVVFCNGFYDIYDKRTETADFTKKQIVGARAAKQEDTDISSKKKVFKAPADVTGHYVHRERAFQLHYLHYAGTDGTIVYGAFVTLWSARFQPDPAGNGATNSAVKIYREDGMKRAMDRWNEKDYYFEEADDKLDIIVKHLCLFEAKDIETAAGTEPTLTTAGTLPVAAVAGVAASPGVPPVAAVAKVDGVKAVWSALVPATYEKRGGKATCLVSIKDDSNGGSSAGISQMTMRRSGALDEGEGAGGWGHDSWPLNPPGPVFPIAGAPRSKALTPVMDYDGAAKPASAFAHELGHAAIGLWDDYATGKLKHPFPAVPNETATSNSAWAYTTSDDGDKDGQRYFGMPYEVDAGGGMKTNRAVRLRYFWGRAKWLNGQAKAEGDHGLKKFLSDKRFRIAYDATAGKLKYTKPDEPGFESIYEATKFATPHVLGRNGRCDLHLYHLGDDEFSKSLNGGPYTGILAMCIKMSAAFTIPPLTAGTAYKTGDLVKYGATYHLQCKADHTSPLAPTTAMINEKWGVLGASGLNAKKISHLETLSQFILSKLQEKFKLQGNGHFSTTFLRVFPQWKIVDPGAHGGEAHFNFNFKFGSEEFIPAGSTVAAGIACKQQAIVRYLVGKIGDVATDWPAQGGLEAELTKDDFPQLKAWMDANATGRFNVGDI